MPPGPRRRKPVKKKNKNKNNNNKPNKNSVSSSALHLRHGDNDGGQVSSQASKSERNSPHPDVKTEKPKSNLSIETNENAAKEKQGMIEGDKGSNSPKPHEKSSSSTTSSSNNKSPSKKKSALIEPATVAEYLAQPIESSSPEKGSQKVENLTVKIPPSADPVKPVDTKIQEKDDLVVAQTPFVDTVNNCIGSNAKDNEVTKTSPKLKDDCLILDSENVKCPYCGKSDDRVREPVTPGSSERQPLIASAPRAAEKSSWKSCCGIFELFSGSGK